MSDEVYNVLFAFLLVLLLISLWRLRRARIREYYRKLVADREAAEAALHKHTWELVDLQIGQRVRYEDLSYTVIERQVSDDLGATFLGIVKCRLILDDGNGHRLWLLIETQSRDYGEVTAGEVNGSDIVPTAAHSLHAGLHHAFERPEVGHKILSTSIEILTN